MMVRFCMFAELFVCFRVYRATNNYIPIHLLKHLWNRLIEPFGMFGLRILKVVKLVSM